MNDIQTL